MRKLLILTGIFLFVSGILFTSCNKNEDSDPVLPTINLKTGADYITANTSAGYGDTLLFGLIIGSNGTDNLVKFKVLRNDASILDSTINTSSFSIDVTAVKNTDATENWKFETTDIAGNINSVSVTVTGAFGSINTYPVITLGAQQSTTLPSFLSYSNNTFTTYFQADAFNHQSDIDMFCFYEDTPTHQNYMSLGSPGSNITGIFTGSTAPENYTVKNLTWLVKTSMTTAQFDAITNDATILASYDPNNKFKKAKTLTVGDIYAFLTQSGKYGLFKVTGVTNAYDGTLEFAVKIQQ